MNLQELRELVWGEDIASPTCPEYREHHESIQKILSHVDSMRRPRACKKLERMKEHLRYLQLTPDQYIELIPAMELAIVCMGVVCDE
jgi:hypothetical protein